MIVRAYIDPVVVRHILNEAALFVILNEGTPILSS
jgi:hypothetical protein